MFGFKKKKDPKFQQGDMVKIEDAVYSQFEATVRSYNKYTELYTVEIKDLKWHDEFEESQLEKK